MSNIYNLNVAAQRSLAVRSRSVGGAAITACSCISLKAQAISYGLCLTLAIAAPVVAEAGQANVYVTRKATHSDPAAEIANLKAMTAALVAAAKQLPDLERSFDRPLTGDAVPGAIRSFTDCADVCPEMVVVPAGDFTMGTTEGEAGHKSDEGPRRRVTINQAFAVGRFAVTVAEYEAFTSDTGRAITNGCNTVDERGNRASMDQANWRYPGFDQGPSEPVVCISWDDAKAYADWMTAKTSHGYRLMSEAEWEYAARAGSQSQFAWGDGEAHACAYANIADATLKAGFPDWSAFDCEDGFAFTAAGGKFAANAFGLYDMAGNVWSWTADCYADYAVAPIDGSANLVGQCAKRVLRGGSWGNDQVRLRVADRDAHSPNARGSGGGFRIARSL